MGVSDQVCALIRAHSAVQVHRRGSSKPWLPAVAKIETSGGQHSPTVWDGAPPCGHHREGVLRFKPSSPLPRSIKLQIARAGEDAPR